MIAALLSMALLAAPLEGQKTVAEVMDAAPAAAWAAPDPEQTLYLDLEAGRIVILLSPDLAQNHVVQIKTLVREGFYDGLHFYRVIEGFVAQGGDQSEQKPKGTAKDTLKAEFDEQAPEGLAFTPLGFADGYAKEAGFINGFPAGREGERVWLAHCTGAFAFARDVARDTASTEFYITLQPQRYLDRNLTVVGRVILGMEVVQSIPRGVLNNSDIIKDEARWTPILSAAIAADLPEEERVAVEILDTNSQTFKDLIKARANRASDFFYYRPNHIDLCQLPLPVRMTPPSE